MLASIAPVANMPGGRHATARPPRRQLPPGTQESWEVFYLQNAKIGYGQVVVRIGAIRKTIVRHRLPESPFDHAPSGGPAVQIENEHAGNAGWRVLEFTTDMAFGTTPVTVRGRVERDKMTLETTTKGTKQTSQIPWSKDVRGFRAVEQSLERRPLKPGEKRKLKMLMPLLNQVAEVELAGERL